jgi:2-dehydro-3-deoxyphosphogluconate aldolase/(4S)-4-hydroxy-2-oxoglutarate aldolase
MAVENINNINDIYAKIINYGIIPKITITAEAKSLSSGGLNIAEIKFDTEQAANAVKKISFDFPGMLLIASGVSTLSQLKSAEISGAKAIMSPGVNREIISYCIENNIPVIPECSNADDIEEALDEGIDIAGYVMTGKTGDIETLNELSSKYPRIKFVISGEITENNFMDYLTHKSVMACRVAIVFEKDPASLIIYKMLGFDLAHVAINCEQSEQAEQYSNKFESLFGLKKSDDGISVSNADIIHFMKAKSYGKNGQIALSTNFIDRAVFYLKEKNHEFIEESARFNGDNELNSIYLDTMIGGFAIKLVKK